jgi:hypothetical protein
MSWGSWLGKYLHSVAGSLILSTILVCLPAAAQSPRGSVSGTATDSQSAAVGDVQVTLTNQDTGVVQTVVTNDSGFYRISAIEPGAYLVEFTKAGFQKVKSSTIEVTASKENTVNAEMIVGAVSSEIFVTVSGMDLDKISATVRVTLPGRVLDEIPLSTSSLVPGGARNAARYPLFAPGIARVLFQNETSANGHRGRENNYMLDGADNNDQSVTLPALFIPPEAIREIDVQAASFSAEFGRNIGAQVNVVTRNGTNRFSGELWEFYRSNELEPLSLTSRIAGLKTSPRLVDNQFGGAFGGPIARNRTFFFGMLQGNLLRTGPRAMTAVTIPTPTGYAALQGVPLRAAPTAQSAASRQAVLQALAFLPEIHSGIQNYDSISSTAVNGSGIELGSFRPVIPSRQNLWYGVTRVDHELAGLGRLTYRGHIERRITPLSTGNLAFGERWAADTKYYGQNHLMGFTWTPGSRFINEARVSYARLFPSVVERDPVSSTVTLTNLFQIGGNANFPQERLEQTVQVQNVSSLVVSRHVLRFGVDLARTKLVSNNAPNAKGTWVFANLQNFLNNQATSLAFLGAAPNRFQFHQLRQAYFFQDDFKVTPSFTANFGLRYETSSMPLGFFGATTQDVLSMGVPGPVVRDTNNWGPRAGFAYSPQAREGWLGSLFGDGESSIRGGFGVGYDLLYYAIAGATATNYPRTDNQLLAGATAPIDVFPALPPKVTTPTLSSATSFINVPSNAQLPTSHYWTLSIQRQLSQDYKLEIGYNGNRSYYLIKQGQANPGILSAEKAAAVIAGCTALNLGTCQDPAGFPASPSRLNPNWASRTLLETSGKASYNGAYLQVSGRTSWGLRFGTNYTWSSNLSDSEELFNDSIGSADGGLAGSSPQLPQDFLNTRNEWSRSVFDRPHRMTVYYNYDIPWFSTSSTVLDHVFRGWQLSGFTELQSGQPFTLRLGVDALGNGGAPGARPDYNPGGVLTKDPSTGNLRTFVTPRDGSGIVTAPSVKSAAGAVTFLRNSMPRGGNLGRNTLRGPGYANFNMSLMKRISLPGDRQLQLRGDFINVFNHDNFPNPDNNMSSVTFGKQIWSPLTDSRLVLLGVKLVF